MITIGGGDTAGHLAQGTPIVQNSVDTINDVAAAQGYSSMGNLGPGNNSQSDLSQAFDNLAKAVKCGDYVLIYICGHGKKSGGGGIAMKNSSGKTEETMKPGDLADLLGKIDACPDQDCETPGVCCHVSVIIESCYAGNFNTPGVNGPGRAVVGTSTDTPSRATPEGGVYTNGFADAAADPDADTTDPPDGVDPMEASSSGEAAVDKHRQANKTGQKPWSTNKWCECKCPCKPGIDVEKWVQLEMAEGWADEVDAFPGQMVTFRLDIESSGKCRGIVDVEMVDFLPDCLEYGNEAVLYAGGESYDRPPDNISQGDNGLELTWNLEEIGTLAPGETVSLEYTAYAEDWGENLNIAYGSGHCSEDYSVVVTDQDAASVWVVPPLEDLMVGYLDVNVESFWSDATTCESFFDIYFRVDDLTGGDFPLTNVTLNVNGEPVYDSGPISETIIERTTEPMEADCGDVIHVELVAMSLASTEPVVLRSQSFVTPTPTLEDVLYAHLHIYVLCHYINDECQGCDVTYTLTAEDLTGGEMPVTGVALYVNGMPFYSSGPISEVYFQYAPETMPAGCADIIDVEMVAMNLIGLESNVTTTIDTSEHDTIVE